MGQLNLLPKKSWHVYNLENQERVLKDEKAHKEQLDKDLARQKNYQKSDRLRILRENASLHQDSNLIQTPHILPSETVSSNSSRKTHGSDTNKLKHVALFDIQSSCHTKPNKEYLKENADIVNKKRLIPHTKLAGDYSTTPWYNKPKALQSSDPSFSQSSNTKINKRPSLVTDMMDPLFAINQHRKYVKLQSNSLKTLQNDSNYEPNFGYSRLTSNKSDEKHDSSARGFFRSIQSSQNYYKSDSSTSTPLKKKMSTSISINFIPQSFIQPLYLTIPIFPLISFYK
ncbi:hypothetical protein BB561_003562 [Smittium simulii]|uniref:CBF1-interacting co-repressor CIR N-terminal domain-containing protein n=1 Tax=Smittium simulii TaxID=133385 RepID=A0A2T9YKV0_9FUNG|nr:hypothetical protein BB561_003562 [Smittium simulii]